MSDTVTEPLSNTFNLFNGDINVGRGQFGRVAFATLSAAGSIHDLWTLCPTRPLRLFVDPTVSGHTIRLPAIGSGANQANNGFYFYIKNTSTNSQSLAVTNSANTNIATLTPGSYRAYVANSSLTDGWEVSDSDASSSTTLQNAYDNSSNPEIVLSTARGDFHIANTTANDDMTMFSITSYNATEANQTDFFRTHNSTTGQAKGYITGLGGNVRVENGGVTTSANMSMALGANSAALRTNGLAFGAATVVTGDRGIALGSNSVAGADAVAIGGDATTGAHAVGTAASADIIFAAAAAGNYLATGVGRSFVIHSQIRDYLVYNSTGTVPAVDNVFLVPVAITDGQSAATIAGNMASAINALAGLAAAAVSATLTITQDYGGVLALLNAADTGTNIDDVAGLTFNTNVVAGTSIISPIAIGSNSSASADSSISIGLNTVASGINAITIGSDAAAEADDAIAIGNAADANTGTSTIAIGNISQAAATNAAALGHDAQALFAGTVAIGKTSVASAVASVSIGQNATASGAESVAIGGDSAGVAGGVASGARAVAIGSATDAVGDDSVSVGYNATSPGTNSTAVGKTAAGNATGSVAIGADSVADTANTTSVGQGAITNTGAGGTALGALAATNEAGATAIGYAALATGVESIAIGGDSAGTAANAANATGAESIAVGTNSLASNIAAIAVGSSASVSAQDSIGVGTTATVSGTSSVGIGKSVSNTQDNSVALGYAAQVITTGSGQVAIGASSTASAGAGLAVGYGAQATGAESIAIGGDSGGSTAAAANATAAAAIAIGTDSAASASAAIAVGQTAAASAASSVAIGDGSIASSTQAVAVGFGASASVGSNDIAIGTSASASAATAIAIGNSAAASASAAIVLGGSSTASAANAVSIGASITNAQSGTTVMTDGGAGITASGTNRLIKRYTGGEQLIAGSTFPGTVSNSVSMRWSQSTASITANNTATTIFTLTAPTNTQVGVRYMVSSAIQTVGTGGSPTGAIGDGWYAEVVTKAKNTEGTTASSSPIVTVVGDISPITFSISDSGADSRLQVTVGSAGTALIGTSGADVQFNVTAMISEFTWA